MLFQDFLCPVSLPVFQKGYISGNLLYPPAFLLEPHLSHCHMSFNSFFFSPFHSYPRVILSVNLAIFFSRVWSICHLIKTLIRLWFSYIILFQAKISLFYSRTAHSVIVQNNIRQVLAGPCLFSFSRFCEYYLCSSKLREDILICYSVQYLHSNSFKEKSCLKSLCKNETKPNLLLYKQ